MSVISAILWGTLSVMPPFALLRLAMISSGASSVVYLGAIDLNVSDIVLIVVAVIGGLAAWRAGASNLWRSNYEASRIREQELRAELTEVRAKLAAAEERPDLRELMTLLTEQHKREREMWQQLVDQFQALVGVLERNGQPILKPKSGL